MSALIDQLRNAQGQLQQLKELLVEIDTLGDSKVVKEFCDASFGLEAAFFQTIAALERASKRSSCQNLVRTRLPFATKLTLEPACEVEKSKLFASEAESASCINCCMHTGKTQTSGSGLKYMLIGPQGIGKSQYAQRIAKALGVNRILDHGHDWPDNLEAAFVANTLLIDNAIQFPTDKSTTVFNVADMADIRSLVADLETTPIDTGSAETDLYKGVQRGDRGTIIFETRDEICAGTVIGVYPGSIRVSFTHISGDVSEYTFQRATGMTRHAQIRFRI